jgi:hypothetical protein
MTVFVVETYNGQTTIFATREVAEQSIKQTRDKLVGGGYIGNLSYTLDEVVVHERPFDVRN